MADPLPCPICGLGGGFHHADQHRFGTAEAKARWGSPLRPAIEREGYTPFAYRAGDNQYVIIWRKG